MTDYDNTDIPSVYDRARDHGPVVSDLWMRMVAEAVGNNTVSCHFADRAAAARECQRVLSPNGTVAIRTATAEQIASYPCTPFFPPSVALMEETLPGRADVRGMFAAAKLSVVDWKLVAQTIAPDWSVYAEKLAAGGDSILARLSTADFEDGLAAVRRYASTGGREPVAELIDFFICRHRSNEASIE